MKAPDLNGFWRRFRRKLGLTNCVRCSGYWGVIDPMTETHNSEADCRRHLAYLDALFSEGY